MPNSVDARVQVAAKPWYKSKTMLVNIAVVFIGIVLVMIPAVVEQQEILGLSKKAVAVIGLVGTFLGLVNGVLRAMTDRPLGPEGAPRAVKAPRIYSKLD